MSNCIEGRASSEMLRIHLWQVSKVAIIVAADVDWLTALIAALNVIVCHRYWLVCCSISLSSKYPGYTSYPIAW